MKKLYYLIIFFLICRMSEAQNIVLNGDLEQFLGCPSSLGQIDSALFWICPQVCSSEYYNACNTGSVGVPANFSGYQNAHSGVGYAGIYLLTTFPGNYREYIEGTLSSQLSAGTCYHFEMYFNLGNPFKYTTADIGVYFSDTVISGITNYLPLPFTPQINNTPGNTPDTLNWTLVSGTFTASGGENYFVIGNFKYDSLTTTTVYNASGSAAIYVLIDDVSLTPCTGIEETGKNNGVTVFPNPVNGLLKVKTLTVERCEIILYDITSRKLFEQSFINSISINTEQLEKGIYIYEVRSKNKMIEKGKVVKQ